MTDQKKAHVLLKKCKTDFKVPWRSYLLLLITLGEVDIIKPQFLGCVKSQKVTTIKQCQQQRVSQNKVFFEVHLAISYTYTKI